MAKALTLLLASGFPIHTQAANLNDLRIVCSKFKGLEWISYEKESSLLCGLFPQTLV